MSRLFRPAALLAALGLALSLPASATESIEGIVPASTARGDRAEPSHALHLLAAAAQAYQADPARALVAFDDGLGPFQQGSLYVFVIDTRTGRMLANGGFPGLTGQDVRRLQDARGAAVGEAFLTLPKDALSTVSYRWRNPASWQLETKHAQALRLGDVVIAVGHYERSPRAERKLHPALG